MSKLVQRGVASAMRARNMSTITDPSKLTPQQIEEFGRRLNPAQTVFGPKSAKVEELQKFYLDPINAKKPMYRRKGASDDIIFGLVVMAVLGEFAANLYTCVKEF